MKKNVISIDSTEFRYMKSSELASIIDSLGVNDDVAVCFFKKAVLRINKGHNVDLHKTISITDLLRLSKERINRSIGKKGLLITYGQGNKIIGHVRRW